MPEENAEAAKGSFDINATSVFYKRDMGSGAGGMSAAADTPAIFCKHLAGGAWTAKSFLPGKSFIKVGTSSSDCDLTVPAAPGISRVHMALRLVLNTWFALEYAPERAMSINGTRRPQAILREGEACIVALGETQIALKSVSKKAAGKEGSSTASFDPTRPLIHFKTKDREYKMGLDACGLIGSDVECRIQAPDLAPIAGVVFSHHGRPFLHSVKGGAPLTVDGQDASAAPKELKEGSIISQGTNNVFSIAIKPLPEPQTGLTPPADFKGNLALLDISDNRFGAKLILPPSGRSLMIGRDASNHFMLESPNVSKKHAQLIIYDNSVLILDAHSTNGCFIEDEQIAKKLLHPGEIVRFADRRFLLCHSE